MERAIAGFDPSAGPIVPVDPNVMMMTPAPMPRNPAPISSPSPVTIAIRVIRPVVEVDADTECFGSVDKAVHGNEHRKK